MIRESDLKWRLEDEKGNLVPVPAFTLELFQELLELQSRMKDRQMELPKATFASPIELDGSVGAEKHFAHLQVTFRIKLTPQTDVEQETWTAIPLRLDGTFLDVAAIEHKEAGEVYVTRDETSYVCWLRALPDTTHTIVVPVKVPLQTTGTQKLLKLQLPNMATTMRLTVAEEVSEAFSPSRRSNVSWETQDQETVITADGAGGELDVAWLRRGAVLPYALEATSATVVHVHGNHIWSEVKLKVRSRGEPIDSFIVRLPDKMDLTSGNAADFQITELPTTDENGPKHVLVKRLVGPTRELIEVHLEAELPPPTTAEAQGRTIQLAGFSVQDAVRQWGSVDVTLDGNWSPTWLAGQFVQRVAAAEDPARQQSIAARFLFDRQPYSLRLELRPKQTRVTLDATYVVDVADDNIELDARIAYSNNGTKVDSLSFKMPGWTIESVTPQEILAKPLPEPDEQGTLTLPIVSSVTELEFSIRARRAIERDAVDVSFDLPRPANLALVPNATLIVLARDNVELTPEPGSIKWLIQETRLPTIELPERFAAPLVFREELSSESEAAARFAARRRIRPRETAIAVSSDVTVDGEVLLVRQTLSADVAYEPLAELTVTVPTAADASGTLQITSGEQDLTYSEVASPEADSGSAAGAPAARAPFPVTALVVSLPAPVTGELQLEFAYELPLKDIVSAEGLLIPLVQPAGGEATEKVTNTLTLRSDEKTAITLADESWTLQPDTAVPIGSHELRVRSAGVTPQLRTSIVESRTNGSTSIRRVWIQSWLTPTDRLDRVCFQLQSDQPLVRVQLPSTALAERKFGVLVEGEPPIKLVDHGDLSLTVTLTDDQVGRVVGLEVGYFCENSRDTQLGVALPTILDAGRAERVYWQVVLPRDEHLAWTPATLTSELVWQRDQWYWGRRGRLEQQALEELVGASTQDPVPTDTNRYLFSSTGSVESVSFVKVNRLMLMSVASGMALALGLPFIYLPVLRHPAVFFVLGVALLGIAVTYPEHTAGVGQAGAVGLGLAIVACALRRLFGTSSVPAPVVRRGSVYTTPDSQASGGSAAVPDGSSRGTTATAPAHLQVARAEGES